VTSAGLPILVLRAPGPKTAGAKPRVGEFDYFAYIEALAGRRSHVVFGFIEDTDHSFANRFGRTAVRQNTEHWLNACFPLAERGDTVLGALSVTTGNLSK
jgi:hypothetical protein